MRGRAVSAEEIRERDSRRARFIGRVRRELKQAVADAKKNGVTRAQIAKKIGRQPAVITRQLNGEANLTLSSIGDLAWALGLYPRFKLFTAKELTGDRSNSAAQYSARITKSEHSSSITTQPPVVIETE
jgi:plasmid maintenance system antidote protein VapI